LSLLYLLNVFLNVIQTAIARFISIFKANHDTDSVNYTFVRGLKYLSGLGLLAFSLYLLLGLLLVDFLHIPFSLYLYQGVLVPFLFVLALNRGLLQGLQRFLALGLNHISEGLCKLTVGIGLVFLGFGVAGAVWGVTASYIGAFLFSFFPLRLLYRASQKKVEKRGIISYSLPVLLVLLALTALYSFDMLLVKHYFPADDAGFYAAASLLGKIVFFATLSIALVMFPKVAESYEQKDYLNVKRVLNLSLFFITAMALGILASYLMFPDFVILALFGQQFLAVKPLMWLFALVYGVFSLIYALCMYNLSIRRYSFLAVLLAINIAEVILIVLFHASLMTVLSVVAFVLLAFLLFLLFYTYLHRFEVVSAA